MSNSIAVVTDVKAFAEMSGAELLAWFNENVRPESARVKRFADKATAVKRCVKLFGEIEASKAETETEESDDEFELRMKAEIEANTKRVDLEIPDAKVKKAKAPRLEARIESGESIRLSSNSVGIAKSWDVAEVKEARLTRNGVTVSYSGINAVFKSLRVAFAELGLPDAKHIKFRGELKKEGVKVFSFDGIDYKFTVLN